MGTHFLVQCAYFCSHFLKMQQKKPKAICQFGLESENTEAEETAQHKIFFFLFKILNFEHAKYFLAVLLWPWDECSGQFLIHLPSDVHLYVLGDCSSSPCGSASWYGTEVVSGALQFRACRRCWIQFFLVTSSLRVAIQGAEKRHLFAGQVGRDRPLGLKSALHPAMTSHS